MCGRFAYFGNGSFGYESLQLPEPPTFESYNITPSQDILAVRVSPVSNQPEYAFFHWGLIPSWSKTAKTKYLLNNARADGIEKKPSFRSPFKHRRCIIPASGFYEWLQQEKGKQPFFIHPADGGYFAMAGLWDRWDGEDGKVIESCAIITTEANGVMSRIHDRMPVILPIHILERWLSYDATQQELLDMLRPCPEADIFAYPVSKMVNYPQNNGPGCIAIAYSGRKRPAFRRENGHRSAGKTASIPM